MWIRFEARAEKTRSRYGFISLTLFCFRLLVLRSHLRYICGIFYLANKTIFFYFVKETFSVSRCTGKLWSITDFLNGCWLPQNKWWRHNTNELWVETGNKHTLAAISVSLPWPAKIAVWWPNAGYNFINRQINERTVSATRWQGNSRQTWPTALYTITRI